MYPSDLIDMLLNINFVILSHILLTMISNLLSFLTVTSLSLRDYLFWNDIDSLLLRCLNWTKLELVWRFAFSEALVRRICSSLILKVSWEPHVSTLR